jgi:hypothetical protein
MKFSVLTGARSMNEVYPLEEAVAAYDRMMSSKARFRVVLTTKLCIGSILLVWVVSTLDKSTLFPACVFSLSQTGHEALYM